ncbi:hypothetical protein dsx2_1267 [Desulfovibrio sp. X2]|nr:hypothetical protein dsx2_1267 [Desulfovibrio sp. X2]
MGIHGVDANEFVTLSNMKFLAARMRAADRILSY